MHSYVPLTDLVGRLHQVSDLKLPGPSEQHCMHGVAGRDRMPHRLLQACENTGSKHLNQLYSRTHTGTACPPASISIINATSKDQERKAGATPNGEHKSHTCCTHPQLFSLAQWSRAVRLCGDTQGTTPGDNQDHQRSVAGFGSQESNTPRPHTPLHDIPLSPVTRHSPHMAMWSLYGVDCGPTGQPLPPRHHLSCLERHRPCMLQQPQQAHRQTRTQMTGQQAWQTVLIAPQQGRISYRRLLRSKSVVPKALRRCHACRKSNFNTTAHHQYAVLQQPSAM